MAQLRLTKNPLGFILFFLLLFSGPITAQDSSSTISTSDVDHSHDDLVLDNVYNFHNTNHVDNFNDVNHSHDDLVLDNVYNFHNTNHVDNFN
ncbi:hypothetical protein FO519_009837, partial [Halicephalobus sp. NKZ332]